MISKSSGFVSGDKAITFCASACGFVKKYINAPKSTRNKTIPIDFTILKIDFFIVSLVDWNNSVFVHPVNCIY